MSNDIVNDVSLDSEGFLLSVDDWNQEVAFELATSAGLIKLTDEHWKVIEALRSEYRAGEPEMLPRVSSVCEPLGMPKECIVELFGDPVIAWRVAGLPKPALELTAVAPHSKLA